MRAIPVRLSSSLLAPLLVATACSSETVVGTAPFEPRPPDAIALATPLNASFDEPILLTVTAPRPRARYLVDEGYTLALDTDGTLSFATDSAGNLVLAFAVDGAPALTDADRAGPPTIAHAASDLVIVRVPLAESLEAEVRFAAVSSGVAVVEAVVSNTGDAPHDVVFLPFLRRCDGAYTDLQGTLGGAAFRHFAPADALTKIVGPGTFVEELADGLASEDPAGVVVTAGA